VSAGEPVVAVVLTQVADAEPLAAACALRGVPVDAVPGPVGAMAVCRAVEPGEPEQAAEAISRLLANTPVLLVVRRDGQLVATRWSGGTAAAQVAPGLLLDGMPREVEGVLLGTVTLDELDGVVTSVGLSRWRATRMLARCARARRRSNPV
jgi:hypothetical protein